MSFYSNLLGSAGVNQPSTTYEISRSLRFNSNDSAYLSKNFGFAGNRKTWTWSAWVKRTKSSSGATYQSIFTAGIDGNNNSGILFDNSDRLEIWNVVGNVNVTQKITSQVFRDFSSWYHLVVSATSSTLSLYVNGVEVTAWATNNQPGNEDWSFNAATTHYLARYWDGSSSFPGDFYLADIWFLDGLTPTTAVVNGVTQLTQFGEFDTNGVWQPKAWDGAALTGNSFHLPFSDNSTAAALGTDTSSNGNTWTVNNIAVGGAQPVTVTLTSTSGNDSQENIDKLFDGNTSNPMILVGNTGTTSTCTFTPYLAVTSGRLYTTGGSASNKTIVTDVGNISVSSTGWTSLGSATKIYSFSAVMQPGDGGWYVSAIESNSSILTSPGSVTVTAGNDSLVDSPTSYGTDTGAGGEVRGNYCTLNPLDLSANISLTNGNLDAAVASGSSSKNIRSTIFPASGKWYWEMTNGTVSTFNMIGIASRAVSLTSGAALNQIGGYSYGSNGNFYITTTADPTPATFTSGDVIGCAWDIGAGTLQFYKNGISQGTISSIPSGEYAPAFTITAGSDSFFANFGQRPFAYTAPSGFKALCTTNLPEPTGVVAQPNTAMDVKLYTGNGGTQTISGLGFSPDFVWLKSRSSSNWHELYDAIRGTGLRLYTNSTNAENSSTSLSSFDSNGFTLTNTGGGNDNGTTYVAWTWDAGSSTVSNTDGSITSQVRANVSAGFSVVTYTGAANSPSTIGHGLNAVPRFVIVKPRTTNDFWVCYHSAFNDLSKYIVLSSTNAVGTAAANYWGTSSDWTSTTFGVYPLGGANNNLVGVPTVAYCFAPVDGYSTSFSYVGNGSADGVFQYLGFLPKLILIKCSSTTGNWVLIDTEREGCNVDNDPLFPNLSNAEATTDLLDITSNGFKLRSTNADVNTSTATYIGYAWASNPFKVSRAR